MTLPRAVLFDVDGTLAVRGDRGPFDWAKVGRDTPNQAVIELAQTIAAAGRHRIIVMSGRDEVCRAETARWLHAHGVVFDELLMRPHRDNRKDAVVKAQLYREHVEPFYTVAWVVDDRNQVVRMWRAELGLTCMQVADGDF